MHVEKALLKGVLPSSDGHPGCSRVLLTRKYSIPWEGGLEHALELLGSRNKVSIEFCQADNRFREAHPTSRPSVGDMEDALGIPLDQLQRRINHVGNVRRGSLAVGQNWYVKPPLGP